MTKKKVNKTETKKSFLGEFYKKNYKKLMIIPMILFILSIISIISTYNSEGNPIYRDVSLKGGLSVTLKTDSNIQVEDLNQKLLELYPEKSFAISITTDGGKNTGFIIDADITGEEEEVFKKNLETVFLEKFESGESYNSNFISPTLSNAFFRQAIIALLVSFIFMSAVVFLYFRKPVPSGAVVLSAIFDIIVTIGILDLFKIKISVAGIGAIVMLVGYSIDTDVLLTNRLIKEEGTNYFQKTFLALKTGSLMSFTTLMAGVVAMNVTNSPVIYEIALILVIGLLVDYISTWLQNSGILLWWLEKTEK